jgi:hypothetical protein
MEGYTLAIGPLGEIGPVAAAKRQKPGCYEIEKHWGRMRFFRPFCRLMNQVVGCREEEI